MNLTKYFNFKYFIENLKKSKATLIFIVFMFFASNFIFMFANSGNNISVLGLEQLSVISTIFMFILPTALSITLFSYVFKKKSVDFINSMPIDRKTLFISNTVFGSLLLTSIVIINCLILFWLTNLFSNIYVPYMVFIDYILLFVTSYIFIFSIFNLAISLSGNVFTSIIVSILILFFVPLIYFIINSMFFNESIINGMPFYRTYNSNFTYPVNLLSLFCARSEFNLFSYISILKMIILSVIYFIIGIYTFKKRKMEYCEISFKNYKIHQSVKILTLIPILLLCSDILIYDFSLITWLFIIVFIIFYIFVYDLITRKGITDILFNISTSLITAIIVFVIVLIGDNLSVTSNDYITFNDINSIDISLDDFDFHIYNDDFVKIDGKNNIKEILSYIDSSNDNYLGNKYYKTIIVHTDRGDYTGDINFSEEDHQKLRDLIYYKYKDKIDNYYDNLYIASINYDGFKLDDNDIDLLKKSLRSEYSSNYSSGIVISVYMYNNHKLEEFNITSNINDNLNKSIIKFNNKKIFDIIKGNGYNVTWIGSITKFNKFDDVYSLVNEVDKRKFVESIASKNLDFSKDIYEVNMHINGFDFSVYVNLDKELEYIKNEEVYGG